MILISARIEKLVLLLLVLRGGYRLLWRKLTNTLLTPLDKLSSLFVTYSENTCYKS